MNKKAQIITEAVRIFDDALIRAVRRADLEEIQSIKHVRQIVFDMFEEASNFEDWKKTFDAFLEKNWEQFGRSTVQDILSELHLTTSMLEQGMYEDMLEKFAQLKVLGENQKPNPAELVSEEIHRVIDRIALRMIDHANDIGLLRQVLPKLQAVREDLQSIVLLESIHQSSQDYYQRVSEAIRKWADNPKRNEQVGQWVLHDIQKMAQHIESLGEDLRLSNMEHRNSMKL